MVGDAEDAVIHMEEAGGGETVDPNRITRTQFLKIDIHIPRLDFGDMLLIEMLFVNGFRSEKSEVCVTAAGGIFSPLWSVALLAFLRRKAFLRRIARRIGFRKWMMTQLGC
jgi:hypothetical protein